MEVRDLYDRFTYLENCCLHDPKWLPIDVEKVLAYAYTSYDYSTWQLADDPEGYCPDGTQVYIVSLKDGRYGLLEESEDYTGHGCQCNSFTEVYDSMALLLKNGLVSEELRVLVDSATTTDFESW